MYPPLAQKQSREEAFLGRGNRSSPELEFPLRLAYTSMVHKGQSLELESVQVERDVLASICATGAAFGGGAGVMPAPSGKTATCGSYASFNWQRYTSMIDWLGF